MAMAVISGGMPSQTWRSMGATKPTAMAHQGPQRKPASSTGICMGLRALPIWGIWPVRKGSSMHSARHTAAYTRCRSKVAVLVRFIGSSPFQIENLPS